MAYRQFCLRLASCADGRNVLSFNFSTSHCALHPIPPREQRRTSSGSSESSPKNADVPNSAFPSSGSAGAVGRQCRCPQAPARLRVHARRRAYLSPKRESRGRTRGSPFSNSTLGQAPSKGVQTEMKAPLLSFDQLRKNAAECIRLAEEVHPSAHTSFFIEMANRWLTLAERAKATQDR